MWLVATCIVPLVFAVELFPGDDWLRAVEEAADGDVVRLAPGRYSPCGATIQNNRRVTVEGTAGAAETILDCNYSGRHFSIKPGAHLTLTGVSLVNGRQNCVTADCSEANCQIPDCSDALGGAIAVWGGSFVLHDSRISGCSAEGAGAIIIGAGAIMNATNVIFESNEARTLGAGAILATPDSTVMLEGCSFIANTALAGGAGAIAVVGARATVRGKVCARGTPPLANSPPPWRVALSAEKHGSNLPPCCAASQGRGGQAGRCNPGCSALKAPRLGQPVGSDGRPFHQKST